MEIVAQNLGIGSFEDMSRDNRLALLSRMKSRGSNDVYLVDIGHSAKQNLVLLSFVEGDRVRLISARKATRTERKEYEENVGS
jgi:uncharacterized DUF497 family protein